MPLALRLRTTCETIEVDLRAIDHAASITFEVCTNLELARCNKALVSLSFNGDTKVQLHTSPLGHKELFGASRTMPLRKPKNEVIANMS